MYVIIPRNNDWLLSLVKDFDVISLNHEEVKVYWECDIAEVLVFEEENVKNTFDLKKSIRLEGIVNWQELLELREMPFIYLESIKHGFIMDLEGFYGEPGAGETKVDSDEYYVVCHLCEEYKEEFLREQVLKYLPDIRLREIYKK